MIIISNIVDYLKTKQQSINLNVYNYRCSKQLSKYQMIDDDDGHESVPRLTPPSIYKGYSLIIINNKKKNKSTET